MSQTNPMTPLRADSEQCLALPTGSILTAVTCTAAVVGAGWMLVTSLMGRSAAIYLAGPAAAGVAGVAAVAGILVMAPWKSRPISWWMTLWLAAMLVRMVITPGAAILLYFAARLDAFALTLAVATAYLAVLLVEAVVLSRHVSSVLYPSRPTPPSPGH